MGDTPINLNSPEQLSWVIYSRKVKDKTYWANALTHIWMTQNLENYRYTYR